MKSYYALAYGYTFNLNYILTSSPKFQYSGHLQEGGPKCSVKLKTKVVKSRCKSGKLQNVTKLGIFMELKQIRVKDPRHLLQLLLCLT